MAELLTIGDESFVQHPDSGEVFAVPKEAAQESLDEGFLPVSQATYNQLQRQQEADQPVTAAALGGLRAATLGASDVAIRALAGEEGAKAAREITAASPYAAAGGELLTALSPVGPIAGAARLGAGLGARAVGAAATRGTAARIAARATQIAAPGVTTGAAIGAGAGVTEAALAEKRRGVAETAELIAEKAKEGAVIGGVLSLGGFGLGKIARGVVGKLKGASGDALRLKELQRIKKLAKAEAAEFESILARDPALAEAVAAKDALRARQSAERTAGAVDIERVAGPKAAARAEELAAKEAVLAGDVEKLNTLLTPETEALLAAERTATADIQRIGRAAKGRVQAGKRAKLAAPEEVAELRLTIADPRIPRDLAKAVASKIDKGISSRQSAGFFKKLKGAEAQKLWAPAPARDTIKGYVKEVDKLRRLATDPRIDTGLRAEMGQVLGGAELNKTNVVRLTLRAEEQLGKTKLISDIAAEQVGVRAEAREGFAAAKEVSRARQEKLSKELGGFAPQSGKPIERLQSELDRTRAQLIKLEQEVIKKGGKAQSLSSRLEEAEINRKLRKELTRAGLAETTASGIPYTELAASAKKIESGIRSAQGQAFGLGFLAPGAMSGGMGAIVGATGIPFAVRGLHKVMTSKAFTSSMAAMIGAAGKVGQLAVPQTLTRADLIEIDETIGGLDPSTTETSAREALLESGMDQEQAELLGAFQRRRLEAMQESRDKSPASRSRTIHAVKDPRGILRRIGHDRASAEDVEVLKKVSPGMYRSLRAAALVALEEDDKTRQLSFSRRQALQVLVGTRQEGKRVAAMQTIYAAGREEEQARAKAARGQAQNYNPPILGATTLQSAELGGGLGLRS
jgi:hypothetical protein